MDFRVNLDDLAKQFNLDEDEDDDAEDAPHDKPSGGGHGSSYNF